MLETVLPIQTRTAAGGTCETFRGPYATPECLQGLPICTNGHLLVIIKIILSRL